MISYLDQAWNASSDPLEVPVIPFAWTACTGLPGQPRVEVEPYLLSTALSLWPKTHIAKTAKCSACTIRWRQLDYGIVSRLYPSGHVFCPLLSPFHTKFMRYSSHSARKQQKHLIKQDIPLVLITTRRGGYLTTWQSLPYS